MSNRPYRRSGTLWEGRFRSCLAQEEGYVLACYRCVELNPVRACMVEHPADYPWSSYAANGQGGRCGFLTPHPLYQALGDSPEQRQSRYRGLLTHHLDPGLIDEIRDATNSGFALGSERLQREMAAVVKRRAVRRAPGRRSRGEGKRKTWSVPLLSTRPSGNRFAVVDGVIGVGESPFGLIAAATAPDVGLSEAPHA